MLAACAASGRLRDDRHDISQYPNILSSTADRFEPADEVGGGFVGTFRRRVLKKNDFSVARSQCFAFSAQKLGDNRLALRRAIDVERPTHREMFAPVVEHVHFVRFKETSLSLVVDESVVFPTVPEPVDETEIFLVAFEFAGCGKSDPTRSAAADLIQRRKAPGEIIRLVLTGCSSRQEADPARLCRKSCDQCRRLEGRSNGREIIERPSAEPVGKQDEIETRLFRLCNLRQQRIETEMLRCRGLTPGGGVMAERCEGKTEIHQKLLHSDRENRVACQLPGNNAAAIDDGKHIAIGGDHQRQRVAQIDACSDTGRR